MPNHQQKAEHKGPLTKIGGFLASMFNRSAVQADGKPAVVVSDALDTLIDKTQLKPAAFKPTHPMVNSWGQYKLLHVLLKHQEVSRRKLSELTDVANLPDMVSRMNRNGWSIQCHRRKQIDSSGRARYPGFFSLSNLDRHRARLILFRLQVNSK